MKMFVLIATCLCVCIAVVYGSYNSGSYGGGAGGYSGPSKGSYGGGGGYGGPKSSAADALKSFYNSQDVRSVEESIDWFNELDFVLKGYNNYNFGYDVQDYVYNNIQSRQESGNPKSQVTGSYSLVEPDGSKRTVNYVADWVNGFRATVSDKNGVTQHGYNSGYGDGDSYGASKGTGYGPGPAADYSGGSMAY